MTKQMLAAMTLAASLGAGSTAAVLTLAQGAKAPYQVHAVDVRRRGELPDGGVVTTTLAYASRSLPDGGRKDVGGFTCPADKNVEILSKALLIATEPCIREE